ncbi:hypothetical protein LXA43DRAFT_1094283 [Ganoderma leucocontextum]|nr:hypothetical protein LXA43DRAFT_1094283 [Ganoderma leucocontextum]
MTALPSKAEAEAEKLLSDDNPTILSLYDTVLLPAENAASEATDDDATFRVMFARVVGYLLLYPPSEQARAVVQSEVERCKDQRDPNQAVYDLGEMYVMDFILPFYSHPDERTPPPSRPCSRASYERIKETAYQGRANRPRNNVEAQPLALIRDDDRCMVTHMRDSDHDSWYPERRGGLRDPQGSEKSLRDGATREDYLAARLWPILERFGYGHIHDELRGDKVHRLENVLTLSSVLHWAFGNMIMWFEEVGDQADCYRVAVEDPKWNLALFGDFGLPGPPPIQFVAHGANLPLPNPTYLRIHAACCRVANLSDAVKYLNYMLDSMPFYKPEAIDDVHRYVSYRLVHSA